MMKRKTRVLATAAGTAAIVLGGLVIEPGINNTAQAEDAVEAGKKLAFSRKKGNCLACHIIAGGESPGVIGPPLVGMPARYPDKAKLREQIWDSTKANPISMMPPFGRHKILSEKEIDQVIEFIMTL